MKLAWMLLLAASLLALGWDSLSSHHKSKNIPATQDSAEWVARENAKKKPCTGVWGGSVSGGYSTFAMSCENGVEVYRDTTAETQVWIAKEDARKGSLAKALVTRCLNAKEMAEVTDLGYEIYVRPMRPFNENEVMSRFNAALLTQQLLQMHCPAKETP